MKKIILTLGLSTLLTMSNLLASDPVVTEPSANESLITQRDSAHPRYMLFPYSLYIKPFVIGRWDVEKTKNDINWKEYDNSSPTIDPSAHGSERTIVKRNFGVGVAFGYDWGKYVGMESSVSYYNHSVEYHQKVPLLASPSVKAERNGAISTNINILNFIFNPVININIINTTSLYCTAGIGFSYVIFSDNANDWDAKGSETAEGTEHRTVNLPKEILNHVRDGMMNVSKSYSDRKLQNSLSWMVGAGIIINLTENIGLDIGYSYKSLGKLKTFSGSMPIDTHEMHVGVKISG